MSLKSGKWAQPPVCYVPALKKGERRRRDGDFNNSLRTDEQNAGYGNCSEIKRENNEGWGKRKEDKLIIQANTFHSQVATLICGALGAFQPI